LTDRQIGNLTVLLTVTKCLPAAGASTADVSCTTGIQVQYASFDVQINSDFQFSVNGLQ